MRICMISKYPPIEGGESAKVYWLLRGLGQRGHEIHVVTNSLEVESPYRERLTEPDLNFYQPAGVRVHNTDPFVNPAFIPYANPYTEKLASYAIDIVRQFDCDVIDSWYVLPYGIAGFMAKTLTQKPFVLRHAGSDISRLFASPYLHTLFREVFLHANRVVTYPRYRTLFTELGITDQSLVYNKTSVDTEAFNPCQRPFDWTTVMPSYRSGVPVVTFLGKYGVSKGILELVEALEGIHEEFLFVAVAGELGREKLGSRLESGPLAGKALILDHVPPWRVPSLLTASTCLVHAERDFSVVEHSPILPREAMASGTCVVLSTELYAKRFSDKMQDKESLLTVDPKDIEAFRTLLARIIHDPDSAKRIGQRAREVSEEIENFPGYLDSTETMYESLTK